MPLRSPKRRLQHTRTRSSHYPPRARLVVTRLPARPCSRNPGSRQFHQFHFEIRPANQESTRHRLQRSVISIGFALSHHKFLVFHTRADSGETAVPGPAPRTSRPESRPCGSLRPAAKCRLQPAAGSISKARVKSPYLHRGGALRRMSAGGSALPSSDISRRIRPHPITYGFTLGRSRSDRPHSARRDCPLVIGPSSTESDDGLPHLRGRCRGGASPAADATPGVGRLAARGVPRRVDRRLTCGGFALPTKCGPGLWGSARLRLRIARGSGARRRGRVAHRGHRQVVHQSPTRAGPCGRRHGRRRPRRPGPPG